MTSFVSLNFPRPGYTDGQQAFCKPSTEPSERNIAELISQIVTEKRSIRVDLCPNDISFRLAPYSSFPKTWLIAFRNPCRYLSSFPTGPISENTFIQEELVMYRCDAIDQEGERNYVTLHAHYTNPNFSIFFVLNSTTWDAVIHYLSQTDVKGIQLDYINRICFPNVTLLSNFKSLEWFSTGKQTIPTENMFSFLQPLPLRHLHLENSNIPIQTIFRLFYLRSIQSFKFDTPLRQNSHIIDLANRLKSNTSLTSLICQFHHDDNAPDFDFTPLKDALKINTSLANLTFNGLRTEEQKVVRKYLMANYSLMNICLGGLTFYKNQDLIALPSNVATTDIEKKYFPNLKPGNNDPFRSLNGIWGITKYDVNHLLDYIQGNKKIKKIALLNIPDLDS